MDKLYISVIITAYTRKQFLLNAIKSVLNQTLDRKYYEIIVVKNFRDDVIDTFIEENKIKNVLSYQKTLGGKLAQAIHYANGTIISMLEDDDMFFENKLQVVYNLFKNNENLVYFHNLPRFIDENKNIIDGVGKAASFNLSCISIRKDTVNIDLLNNTFTLSDSFMLYSALDSGGLIISGNEILSYYMLHNSASNYIGDINSKLVFKDKLFQDFIRQLEIFYKDFKSSKAKKLILNYMVTLKLNVNIFNKLGYSHKHYKIKFNELINYLLIFNYWGTRKYYPLKMFKLLQIYLPINILKKMTIS